MLVLFTALFVYGYIITPALTVYSWMRWAKSQRRRSRRVRVSLAGLALASIALVFGMAAVAFSSIRNGTFLYLSPRLSLIYELGLLAAGVSVLITFAGAFQSNPVQRKALLVAVGVLDFWFLAGSSR